MGSRDPEEGFTKCVYRIQMFSVMFKLILGHFCINLNNPTTVLQQEQARAFFANYDSKKLYSLIMDGTQISITREDYQEAKNISVEFKVKVRIIPQGKEVLNDGWEITPSLICVISNTYVKLSTKVNGPRTFSYFLLLLEKIVGQRCHYFWSPQD